MKTGGNCIPSKPDLKLSRSGACATAAGRQFQLLMVRRKKEYLYTGMFFEVAICLYFHLFWGFQVTVVCEIARGRISRSCNLRSTIYKALHLSKYNRISLFQLSSNCYLKFSSSSLHFQPSFTTEDYWPSAVLNLVNT